MTTAYFNEAGKPRLAVSYCVCADFLGYRDQIKEAIRYDEEARVFERFMEDIEPEIERTITSGPEDDVPGFPRMWDAKVFTDNIVLGYALWSGSGEKEFGHAITQLLEFQYAVALKGYFVRGGWAVGKLFMNPNTVFGGALIEAHELESERAIYPRIILSGNMKELVFRHMARYTSDPPQCYHLLVDDEGALFTNYLSESIVEGKVQWKGLQRHADLVRQRLDMHSHDERVHAKYRWLAAYHNFFCDLVCEGDGYSDDLKITVEFPVVGIRAILHEGAPYVVEMQKEKRRWEEKLAKLKGKSEE